MTQKTLPLTGLIVGSIAPAVLVCGDPNRATQIASYLDQSVLLKEQREYRVFNGRYKNIPFTVCSHGIGAPGAAIAFEELIAAGAKQIIRVGTCGGLPPQINSGDIVIATAAVQRTGYGRETVPDGYPAVADPALTLKMAQAAKASPQTIHSGIVLTRDNFYAGVTTPNTPDYEIMSQANVLAVEMECAALFIVGSLRQVQTAAILAVDGNVLHGASESMDSYQPHREVVKTSTQAAIQIALNTLAF